MRVKEESEKAGLKLKKKKNKKLRSWHLFLPLHGKQKGESGSSDRFHFLGPQNHFGQWLHPWNSKTLAPGKESYDKPKQHIKKQRHHFANKGLYSQSCGFSSGHAQMWELGHIEGWGPKNWYFWTVVLGAGEDSWESLGLQGDQISQS